MLKKFYDFDYIKVMNRAAEYCFLFYFKTWSLFVMIAKWEIVKNDHVGSCKRMLGSKTCILKCEFFLELYNILWVNESLENTLSSFISWFISLYDLSKILLWSMHQQTGRLINLFDFCQPITDVYCAQLTNERAHIL